MQERCFTDEQVAVYLKKLGFDTKPEVSFDTLCAILKRHQQTIPFENLDCMAQKALSLLPNALFDKIVANPRGGLSFELETAFELLLSSLGFKCTRQLANLADIDGGFQNATHIVTSVEIDGKIYICDSGFYHETPRLPLLLEAETEQSDGVALYRFKKRDTIFVLEQKENMFWQPIYSFEDKAADDTEIAAAFEYCASDRHSPFNKSNKISIYLPDTFAYIAGDMMKYRQRGKTIKQLAIEDRRQMNKLLATVFHINFGEIRYIESAEK